MFDPTKPVQTRDGRKARIICTDMNSEYSIVALLTHVSSGNESCESFTSDGFYALSGECGADLINIPETKYLNVYDVDGVTSWGFKFDTKTEARSAAINIRAMGTTVVLEAHPIEV